MNNRIEPTDDKQQEHFAEKFQNLLGNRFAGEGKAPTFRVPGAIRPRFSVVAKTIAAAVIVMMLVAVAQILYGTNSTRAQVENATREQLIGYYQAYASRIEAETNDAQALAISIANRADVQGLYLRSDREALYALLTPMFAELKSHKIVHLYIENPDGTVFLRVHQKDKFGDDITYRQTAVDALMKQQTVAGVEIGPNRLGVRGVAPMYSDGKFIGLVEVGLDFDQQFIDDMKELTGADFTIWVTYEAASAAGMKPAEEHPFSPYDGMFYYASTAANLLPVPSHVYRSVLESGQSEFQVVTKDVPDPTIVYLRPLLGYKDKLFGVLQISLPYGATLRTIDSSFLTIVGISIGLALLGLILIAFLNSQIVLKPLAVISEFANQQIMGNTTARVSVKTGDEFEQLATLFNQLTEAVMEERQLLEQRNKALVTSSEVSRALSNILDQQQLVKEVVEQIRNAFKYYHVHIYIVEESSGDLIMAGGTGKAGQTMLAGGHKVSKGKGLVGRAAEMNQVVLIPDVAVNPHWLPNPLLPETKSEIALPMARAGKVLGVLDVQHNVAGGLAQEDVVLLQSIANQVAIAIQNARAYEQVQSQAKRETLINVINEKIQRANAIEAVLQITAHELGQLRGVKQVSVQLGTPDRRSLNNHDQRSQ